MIARSPTKPRPGIPILPRTLDELLADLQHKLCRGESLAGDEIENAIAIIRRKIDLVRSEREAEVRAEIEEVRGSIAAALNEIERLMRSIGGGR